MVHILAQGSDLNVFLSAGKYLHRVQRVQMEVQDWRTGYVDAMYAGSANKDYMILAARRVGYILKECSLVNCVVAEYDCEFVRGRNRTCPSTPHPVLRQIGFFGSRNCNSLILL